MLPGDDAPPGPAARPASRVICGFWRRIAALLLDSLILGVAGGVSGIFLYDTFSRLGEKGRLIGFCVALVYFGLMNSALGGGQTFGKRAAGIEVVDSEGQHISPLRSGLRYFILGVPFFLNGVTFGSDKVTGFTSLLASFIVLGVGGATTYLYLFNRRTRQSTHDLLVGTFVTMSADRGELHLRPIWRPHLAIAGAWCALILALGLATPWIARANPFPELIAIQRRVLSLGKASSVLVFANETRIYVNGATNRTNSLQVRSVMIDRPTDYELSSREIAAATLAADPGITKQDFVGITVIYGYDIGIAHAHTSRTFQHSPQKWASLVAAQ